MNRTIPYDNYVVDRPDEKMNGGREGATAPRPAFNSGYEEIWKY